MADVLKIILTIVEVLVCLLIIALVLLQRSKGDGLNSAISGGMGEAMFGANVGNVLTRATVILGVVFLLNTIVLALLSQAPTAASGGSVMDDHTPVKPPVTMPGSAMPLDAGTEATTPIPATPTDMPAAPATPAAATPATPTTMPVAPATPMATPAAP